MYKIARNVKLRKLMHAHCRKKQLDFRTARFIHEGHRVPGKYTADKVFFFFFSIPQSFKCALNGVFFNHHITIRETVH